MVPDAKPELKRQDQLHLVFLDVYIFLYFNFIVESYIPPFPFSPIDPF